MNSQICKELDQISPFHVNVLTNISQLGRLPPSPPVTHDLHGCSHPPSRHSTCTSLGGNHSTWGIGTGRTDRTEEPHRMGRKTCRAVRVNSLSLTMIRGKALVYVIPLTTGFSFPWMAMRSSGSNSSLSAEQLLTGNRLSTCIMLKWALCPSDCCVYWPPVLHSSENEKSFHTPSFWGCQRSPCLEDWENPGRWKGNGTMVQYKVLLSPPAHSNTPSPSQKQRQKGSQLLFMVSMRTSSCQKEQVSCLHPCTSFQVREMTDLRVSTAARIKM